jgi:hypothetical protein
LLPANNYHGGRTLAGPDRPRIRSSAGAGLESNDLDQLGGFRRPNVEQPTDGRVKAATKGFLKTLAVTMGGQMSTPTTG